MPNWIEGTMKLRGKMSDIKRFIDEGICRYDFAGEIKQPKSDYIKDSYYDKDELDYEIFNEPHVEGTRRMFIRDSHIWMNEPEGVCCFNIKQAWSFTSCIADEETLKVIVKEVVDANEQSVIDYKNGKDRALGFIVGQIMKKTQGKANPGLASKLVLEEIKRRF